MDLNKKVSQFTRLNPVLFGYVFAGVRLSEKGFVILLQNCIIVKTSQQYTLGGEAHVCDIWTHASHREGGYGWTKFLDAKA